MEKAMEIMLCKRNGQQVTKWGNSRAFYENGTVTDMAHAETTNHS